MLHFWRKIKYSYTQSKDVPLPLNFRRIFVCQCMSWPFSCWWPGRGDVEVGAPGGHLAVEGGMAGGTTAHHLSALQLLTLHLHKGKQWHENSASLYVVIFFSSSIYWRPCFSAPGFFNYSIHFNTWMVTHPCVYCLNSVVWGFKLGIAVVLTDGVYLFPWCLNFSKACENELGKVKTGLFLKQFVVSTLSKFPLVNWCKMLLLIRIPVVKITDLLLAIPWCVSGWAWSWRRRWRGRRGGHWPRWWWRWWPAGSGPGAGWGWPSPGQPVTAHLTSAQLVTALLPLPPVSSLSHLLIRGSFYYF